MALLSSVASLLVGRDLRWPLDELFAVPGSSFFLAVVSEACHDAAARADTKRSLLLALRAVEAGAARRIQAWARSRRAERTAAAKPAPCRKEVPVYGRYVPAAVPQRHPHPAFGAAAPETRVRVITEAGHVPPPSLAPSVHDARYSRKWNPKTALAFRRAHQTESPQPDVPDRTGPDSRPSPQPSGPSPQPSGPCPRPSGPSPGPSIDLPEDVYSMELPGEVRASPSPPASAGPSSPASTGAMEPGSRASAGLSMPAMPAMPEDWKRREESLHGELCPRHTQDSFRAAQTSERIGESTRSALHADRELTPSADVPGRSFGGHARAERRRAAEERGRDLRDRAEHHEGHQEDPGLDSCEGGLHDLEMASQLDFSQLQDLISRQMAEIESTWEAPLGDAQDAPSGVASPELPEPSTSRPQMPPLPAVGRGVFRVQVSDDVPVTDPQADDVLPYGAVAETEAAQHVRSSLTDRRGAYRPKHTYSGRSGGEPVASTLQLKFGQPPGEEGRVMRRRPEDTGGDSGQGLSTPMNARRRTQVQGDRYAYRRARRAEDTIQLE